MSALGYRILAGVGLYLAFLLVLSLAVVLFVRYQTNYRGDHLWRKTWLWFGRWHLLVLLITVSGALAGMLLYPLVGVLMGMDYPVARLFRNGLMDGGFYAFIWAPGISFVTCLVLANRQKGRASGRPR